MEALAKLNIPRTRYVMSVAARWGRGGERGNYHEKGCKMRASQTCLKAPAEEEGGGGGSIFQEKGCKYVGELRLEKTTPGEGG